MLRTLIRKLTPKAKPARPATDAALVQEWPLAPTATLGSAIRMRGIERELKARLRGPARKAVSVAAGAVTLAMTDAEPDDFAKAVTAIAKTLDGIEKMPVLPREIEDILTISSRERHKWLKDGRLQSAGTKTVKLRGRAKAVTFHVFDPQHVDEVLNSDLPEIWRDQDAQAATENRKRGAGKAALTRAGKSPPKASAAEVKRARDNQALKGWDEFEAEGLLR